MVGFIYINVLTLNINANVAHTVNVLNNDILTQ